MKLIAFFFISIGLSFERSVNNTTSLSKANNHFSVQLLQQVFDEHKNVFFSPFSISSALGMVYTGADGETAQEMNDVLGYGFANISDQQIKEQFSEVMAEIYNKTDNNYELNVANRIDVQKGFEVLQTFKDIVQNVFKSSFESQDFATNGKAVMDSINAWVSQQTKGKIDSILSQPLDASTVLVILNAIYFKGLFMAPFDKNLTQEEVFYNDGENQTKTQMMKRTAEFNYTEIPELESRLLEMPYSGDDISLYVVLPNERQGLKKLVNNMTDFKSIEDSISTLSPMKVVVSLPKFKVETKYELSETLSQMGMESLFQTNANLSKIASNLSVSQVIHKAFIEVNEEGTEAAAVTGTVMAGGGSVSVTQSPPILFTADHPFLYIIRNNRNGMILFCGLLNNA